MLTFEQFQASKRFTSTLHDETGVNVGDCSAYGFVYDHGCHIEIMDKEASERAESHCGSAGPFSMVIERESWVDSDLAKLERILFDTWYVPATWD